MPQRIRLSRARGWRMPDNAVYVGRPTPWGNPFVVGVFGNRLECVQTYRALLGGYFCVSGRVPIKEQERVVKHAYAHLDKLRGKDLACWCALPADGQPDVCHAAVLLAIANDLPLNLPPVVLRSIG